MDKKHLYLAGGLALLLLSVLSFGNTPEKSQETLKGRASDYTATSTASNGLYGAFTGDQLVKTGHGTLGSVVITGANTGIVNFYNATTSDATKRVTASSTILIASFPASTVAGTYTFDASFTDGLLVELESGLIPTSTINYR